MQQELKIAGNRIGVLIGKSGATKRSIEERTESVISIDSEEGLVTIEGEDPVRVLIAASAVSRASGCSVRTVPFRATRSGMML